MSKKAISRLLRYGISTILCAVCTASYVLSQDLGGASQKEFFMILTDGFFLPGILLIFCGLLVFVGNNGVFNGVGYVIHVVVHALIPGGRYNMERYGEYVSRKQEKQITGYGFLYIVGALFIVISVVFYVLYSQC